MFKLLTLLAGLAAAYHAPGQQVDGTNPVSLPNSDNPVTVGKPFNVVYDGSGFGDKISILLWRGPGEALVFLKPIADSVENTGTFSWTPDSSLENDITHYGLQVISEASGQFQWSTQFGVINDAPPAVSSSTSSGPTDAPSSSSLKSSLKPTSKLHPPPTKSIHFPSSKPTSPPSDLPKQPPAGGNWAPPPAHSDYTPPSAPETFTSYVAAPKPTGYSGAYSNGAGRFAIGAGSAVIALGAAVLLL